MASEIKPLFYEFDQFSVDIARRRLLRKGEPISLTPKVFDTLLVFLESRAEVLDKERLMSELWSDRFVEESNIAQNVAVLRRALGEKPKENKFIVTIPGRGYRFVAEVKVVERQPASEEISERNGSRRAEQPSSVLEFPHLVKSTMLNQSNSALAIAAAPELDEVLISYEPDAEAPIPPLVLAPSASGRTRSSLFRFAIGALILVVAAATVALIYKYAGPAAVSNSIAPATLAVLPLKPLDAHDNYLGLGVADAIIRRMSQTGTLTVRPTSAIRRYLNEDTDALTAARQLGVDAVLEGTVQRAYDRLRVSVNLLRTSDGRSLWAESFDMPTADVFVIQDKVAQQIATRLQLHLDPAQRERFAMRYTPNAIAYEYYLKAVYNFDQRGFNLEGKPQHEATIGLFRKSIEADPNYAPAHAQLAYAYAWMGVYVDENEQDKWVELAKEEISRADALDPQLAETHIARHHVLLSAHEGFQTEAAARELIQAKKLDPNVGGLDLAVAFNHLGLEDMFDREKQRTLEIDPTSEFNKMIFGFQLIFARRFDDWLAYREKYFDGKPNVPYLMGKGRVDEAQQQFDQMPSHGWDAETSPGYKAILFALKGDRRAAEAEIPILIGKLPHKNNSYHHATYDIACTHALLGNSAEAVKWLRQTAATGFASYPMFERDRYLDRIRQAPEFIQFMEEMQLENERVRQEFERY
jgi:DNA-binding winged helix-turn-helix (wHTH) protein/TolB-like protein